MEQWRRPFAMKRDNSLGGHHQNRGQTQSISEVDRGRCQEVWEQCVPINEPNTNPKRTTETLESEATVGFKKLPVCEDAHFADIVPSMWGEDTGGQEVCLFQGC